MDVAQRGGCRARDVAGTITAALSGNAATGETKTLKAENAAMRDQLGSLLRRVEQLEGKRTPGQ